MLTEERMLDPIRKLLENEYPTHSGRAIMKPEACRHLPTSLNRYRTHADLVYIQGRLDRIHAVEIEPTAARALGLQGHGLTELRYYKANRRWLALPKDEYELQEDEIDKRCQKAGIGVITVRPQGRGLTAEIIIAPENKPGTFLNFWRDLCQEWYECQGAKDRRRCKAHFGIDACPLRFEMDLEA